MGSAIGSAFADPSLSHPTCHLCQQRGTVFRCLIAESDHLNEDASGGAGVGLGPVRLPLDLNAELAHRLAQLGPLLRFGDQAQHGAVLLGGRHEDAEPTQAVAIELHVVGNHEFNPLQGVGHLLACHTTINAGDIDHLGGDLGQVDDEIGDGRLWVNQGRPGAHLARALVDHCGRLNHASRGVTTPDSGRLKVDRRPTRRMRSLESVGWWCQVHGAIMPPSGYDVCMELLLLALLGAGASAITIVSGFGLNTVLVPAFAVLFPLPLAIAAVALVHLIASAIRLVIFRAHINRAIALQFVPWAILGGIAGALILELLGAVPVIATYPLFGITKSITAVKVVVGVTIAVLSLYELRRGAEQVGLSSVGLSAGALASGFFGGLSGNQGAIRSTVLIRAGLTPLGFAATGAAAAVAIDLTRLVVYGTAGSISSIVADGAIRNAIVAATIGAIVGALVGRQLLATMSSERLRLVVGWSLVAGGLLIGTGAL